MASKFVLNNIRTKKISNKFLITNESGKFKLLNKEEHDKLIVSNECENELFHELERKNLIITDKNIKKIEEEYQEKNSFLFGGTSLHIIVPTLRCNMNCCYCHASSIRTSSRDYDMSFELAEKTVDFIFQTPSNSITMEFQGGEPLLNFPVVKHITKYAKKLATEKKKNLHLALVTNLTLMDEEKLSFIIENNISLCTSLDGPKHIHDKNRPLGKSGSYDLVTKWIKKINHEYKKRGIKQKVSALLTLTSHGLGSPKEIIDEYIKNECPIIHLRFLNNLGDARPVWKEISYSPEEFLQFWEKAMEYIIDLNTKGHKVAERGTAIMLKKIFNDVDPGYLDLRSPCGAVIGQMAYNHNGNIYTCDEGRMFSEDIFKLGNVTTDSYADILTCNKTCSIVDASINDAYICDQCAYKPYCGLCPVCNYAEEGTIISNVVTSSRCKIFRKQLDYIFKKIIADDKEFKVFKEWLNIDI